jgi:hypothetical protein
MMTERHAQSIVQNDILLERLSRETGRTIRSFEGWKAVGRFVRRGQKQKSFQVCAGHRTEQDPLTGDDVTYPIFRTAYGFTEDQLS